MTQVRWLSPILWTSSASWQEWKWQMGPCWPLSQLPAACQRGRCLLSLPTKNPWDVPTPLPEWGEVRAPNFDPRLEWLKSFHLGWALGVLRPLPLSGPDLQPVSFYWERRGLICTAWFRSNKVRASLQVKSTLYPSIEMCLWKRFWSKVLKLNK